MFARINFRYLSLAVVGLLAGFVMAYGLSLPRASLSLPQRNGTDVSTTTPIEVRFTRPMQPAESEARFEMEPPVAGTFEWPDAMTMRFQPSQPLPAGTTHTVSIKPGARSQHGPATMLPARFIFTTGQPALLYLTERDGTVNLWRVDADGSNPRQLTNIGAPKNIYAFDVSADGSRIALSVGRGDGGAYLASIPRSGGEAQVLLECFESACVAPVWSPDGRWLAYEQRPVNENSSGVSTLVGQVWVLDTFSGESVAIVMRELQKGTTPVWSPDGTRLTLYEPSLQSLAIYEAASDNLQLIPNQTGERVAWAPDSASLVYTELFFSEADGALLHEHAAQHDPSQPHSEPQPRLTFQHLIRISFDEAPSNDSALLNDLSQVLEVVDGTPTFSPDGRWLAFGRRVLEGEEPTYGRQLWLYDVEDEARTQLISEPTFNHGAFSWSPDSSSIAYMRADMLNPQAATADVWVIDIEDRQPRLLAEGAFLPAWLP